MTKEERTLLNRLMVVCNSLGGSIDRTAVSEQKLYERQRAHMLVSNVLYGILTQHPDNEYAYEDLRKALECLGRLEDLSSKTYPDRNGRLSPEEKAE